MTGQEFFNQENQRAAAMASGVSSPQPAENIGFGDITLIEFRKNSGGFVLALVIVVIVMVLAMAYTGK